MLQNYLVCDKLFSNFDHYTVLILYQILLLVLDPVDFWVILHFSPLPLGSIF